MAVFLDLVGFGMIIPDIQLRTEEMGAAGWQIGAILASTFIIQAFTSTLWGRWSDRIGRKTVFLLCTGISVASMVAYGLAPTLGWILFSRVLAGFGAANVAAAQAAVSDLSNAQTRTAAMGRISAAISSGLIVGAAAGGTVSHFLGSQMVGLIGAGASFIGIVLVALFAKLPPGSLKPTRRTWSWAPMLREFPGLRGLLFAAWAAWFSLAMLEGTFGRLIKDILGLGELEFGMIFSFESAIGVLVQAVFIGWLARRFGDKRIMVVGFLLQGLGLAFTPFAPALWVLFAVSGIYALGTGIANPTVNSVASQMVDEESQGELFGMIQSMRAVGFAVGPIIGGAIFDWQNWSPYLLAGLACLVAAIVVNAQKLPEQEPEPQPAG